jgi:hypothetical protein
MGKKHPSSVSDDFISANNFASAETRSVVVAAREISAAWHGWHLNYNKAE